MRPRVAGMVWLSKADASPGLLEHFRESLTFVPRKVGNYGGEDVSPEPVKCYLDTPEEFGVPRAYWFSNVKKNYNYIWDVSSGESAIECVSSLTHVGRYAEQQDVINVFVKRFLGSEVFSDRSGAQIGDYLGGIFQGDTGVGKCLGRGTPVLRHDGSVVAVEDVQTGDILIGPDGPRRVLSTTMGYGPLYKVIPEKGKPWICNDVHVLTLMNTKTRKIIDIPLDEYIRQDSDFKNHHELFRPDGGVDFSSSQPVPLDPYFFGAWLGGGSKSFRFGRLSHVEIIGKDHAIVSICEVMANRWGCKIKIDRSGNYPTYKFSTPFWRRNELLCVLRDLFPCKDSRIPECYLVASRNDRLELLAGLLDTCGYLFETTGLYEVSTGSLAISDGVERLAFGLGFMVKRGQDRHELYISGDVSRIPLRIRWKRVKPQQKKNVFLGSRFGVSSIGDGEFFGFTLDNDGRFLLGDCTVTHNTETALGIAKALGRTTIILTHKKFLMRQWIGRINKWMPDAKVGVVQESKCQFEGCDFVVAMMESLALDDGARYPQALYDWPGLLILDEAHRVGARTWSPLPPKFTAAYRLGLTATPRRKDDADVIFWWHIGRVVYQAETKTPTPHVRMISVPKPYDPPQVLTSPGKNDAIVINILTKMTGRNNRIVNEIVSALKAPSGRKVMVLSERLEHLRTLESQLRATVSRDPVFEHEDITTGFYVGEWFTGEKVPALKPGQWPMEDGGREKAIKLIYQSISRRKGYSGSIYIEEVKCNGQALVDANEKPLKRKVHEVMIPASDMTNLYPDNGFFSDAAPYPIKLEDLTDEELYGAAMYYRIRQKPKDKMRTQTEAELYEAERARIVFATFQMCSEGVDLPAIDVEVLASPVSDVEQAVGRERRFCDPEQKKCDHFCPWRSGTCQGKPHPIVADIVDLGYPLASKRERYREAFYQRIGCKIARGRR